MPEYLCVADGNNQITAQRKTRAEVHRLGLWHRAVHVFIINDQNELLCNLRPDQRCLSKPLGYHFRWTCWCGESNEETAVRELKEKLGIEIISPDLNFLGDHKSTQKIPEGKIMKKEIRQIFLLRKDLEIQNLKF